MLANEVVDEFRRRIILTLAIANVAIMSDHEVVVVRKDELSDFG